VNLQQTQPQHIARATPGKRYTPFGEKHLQRVLIPPYQPKLLALNGYHIDEKNFIRKDTGFMSGSMDMEQKAPSNNATLISATSTFTPQGHNASNSDSGASSARADSGGARAEAPYIDTASLSSAPRGSASVS
jgi:hypothetical protein